MEEVRSPDKIREIVDMIQQSQFPLADDTNFFLSIKARLAAGQPVGETDYARLVKLAEKAEKWEIEVASSARTDPEHTLPG